jgi:hypothetical protein
MKTENFGLALTRTLNLKESRALATLGDAVAVMGDLPDFPRMPPVWLVACHAIRAAATTGSQSDIEDATCEIELALTAHDLLEEPLKSIPLKWRRS